MTAVAKGTSIRGAARQYEFNRHALKRFLDRKGSGAKYLYGYGALSGKLKIFSYEMESDLATQVRELSERFHSLTSHKCSKLAYESALQNNIAISSAGLR